MRAVRRLDVWLRTLAVLGCLVLANLLALGLVARLDLTRDRVYTLDAATLATLTGLQDPVTVRAYVTRDLPAPLSTLARYLGDVLEEYHARSHGQVRYEVIDPAAVETEADRQKKKELKRDPFGNLVREMTSVEQELQGLGIPSIPLKVNQGDKVESMRGYLGLVISAGGKREVLPLVQRSETLEYELTSRIRKVTRARAPKIALLAGAAGPEEQTQLANLGGLLGSLYQVEPVDPTRKPTIPDDADLLWVVGPRAPLGEEALRAVDRFVMSGRGAAFFLGPVDVDLKTLGTTPLQHGLEGLLAGWGVRLGPGLVVDGENVAMTVSRQDGPMRVTQQVPYPYLVAPRRLGPPHPVTRGLGGVMFPFAAPLSLQQPLPEGVQAEVLARSSESAGVVQPPYDLDPFRRLTQADVGAQGAQDLALALRGALPSQVPAAPGEAEPPARASQARVVVIGAHGMLQDAYLGKANQALVLNLVDWLLADEALMGMRARGLRAAPLEPVSEGVRQTLKLANIAGLPLLLVGFGLVRWRLREARRKRVRV
ncbi:MAG TPA: GldG family protein [Myxococcota bacterium]|nr:GldG family protein [Myxococcota bacterium]HRY91945.1 GldG family protein [Myxococcota bacterium]HSA23542.1 GldG family protein [Myxococcota bacterium]